jgi:hypothetical protein
MARHRQVGEQESRVRPPSFLYHFARLFLVSAMEAKQHGVSARSPMSKRSLPRSSPLWTGRPAIPKRGRSGGGPRSVRRSSREAWEQSLKRREARPRTVTDPSFVRRTPRHFSAFGSNWGLETAVSGAGSCLTCAVRMGRSSQGERGWVGHIRQGMTRSTEPSR